MYCLDSGKTDSSSDEGNNNPCTHQIYDDCTIEVDMFGSPYSYYVNCWIYEYQCANKTTYPSQCNEIAGTRIKRTSEQVDSSSGYSTQKEATQSAINAVSGFEGKFISSSLGCK